ncbi:MAG: rhodanese-like domain-containing protein [Thermodesulfovibrio sp.]|nr:rhodanese-like domain-containing protein [Thermodesulfovibrio sp.]
MKGKALILSQLIVLLLVGFAFVISQSISQEKPIIAKPCTAPGCHTAKQGELWGYLKSASAKAELIQIDTGALWTVKFDEKTKTINWTQPISKIPKDKEILIQTILKNGELYAVSVNVKPPQKLDPSKIIKGDEVKKLVEDKKALIVDSRPPGRYHEGHIPGAINIWWSEFDKHLDKLPKDKNELIVFYCGGTHCALSPASLRRAETLGYTNAKVYHDGMPDWKQRGYPVASTVSYVKELIDKDLSFVLIDVRSKEEAEKEHIPGAVNIPLVELEKWKDKFPAKKGAPILIYCKLDKLSQQAFQVVRGWGYINTSYILGGIEAWKKANYPVLSGQLKSEIVYIPKPKPGSIPIVEFEKIVATLPKDKLIIDVRDVEEVQEGMLKGAKNIPVQEIESRLNEIPKDKEIITHCATGLRAEMAYNILKEKGYKVRFLNATIQIDKAGKYRIIAED